MGNGKKQNYSLRATIEWMENGAQMTIRTQSSATSQGNVVLKKVYVDFDSLVADLRQHMHFNFNHK